MQRPTLTLTPEPRHACAQLIIHTHTQNIPPVLFVHDNINACERGHQTDRFVYIYSEQIKKFKYDIYVTCK